MDIVDPYDLNGHHLFPVMSDSAWCSNCRMCCSKETFEEMTCDETREAEFTSGWWPFNLEYMESHHGVRFNIVGYSPAFQITRLY